MGQGTKERKRAREGPLLVLAAFQALMMVEKSQSPAPAAGTTPPPAACRRAPAPLAGSPQRSPLAGMMGAGGAQGFRSWPGVRWAGVGTGVKEYGRQDLPFEEQGILQGLRLPQMEASKACDGCLAWIKTWSRPWSRARRTDVARGGSGDPMANLVPSPP